MEDVGAGKGTGPGIGDKVVEIPVMENDRSSGHPRTHQGGDVVTEGGLGESSTTTVVHNRGLKSKEGVGMSTDKAVRQHGIVASLGKVVLGKTSLDTGKHTVVQVVSAVDTSLAKPAKADLGKQQSWEGITYVLPPFGFEELWPMSSVFGWSRQLVP
ncbi:hypothetical protein V6N11_065842 [Hibiscus sabdariffa]|uniref:Uncharacterized protein n=1 Tax=Hibiscus sabdariffa TaxID=183260 RepID=A0ABR2PIY1_9ROSI